MITEYAAELILASPARRIGIGPELDKIKSATAGTASISEQVAIILGYNISPTPDYEHDRTVAWIMERFLEANYCWWSCRLHYPYKGEPKRETEIYGPQTGKRIVNEDHNLALCWGVIAVFAWQWAIYTAPDTYCGVERMDREDEEMDRWVADANPR